MKRCNICGIKIEEGINSEISNIEKNRCKRCSNTSALIVKNNPLKSLFYIFDGFKVLLSNPKLIRLSIIPLIITLVILVLTYGGAIYLMLNGLEQYLATFENHSAIADISKFMLGTIGSIFILFLVFFLFLPLSSVVCIPFNDVISSETENRILGTNTSDEKGNILLEVKVGVSEAIKLLILKVFVLAITFPINFIPVIGNVLFLLILTLVISIDFIDIVMARKKYTLSEKVTFLKKNPINFLFFSVPFFLLFWVPVVQILLIPCATIAGTRFFIESEK